MPAPRVPFILLALSFLFGARADSMRVLQYNLGWECMSAWNLGSGKVAAKHCNPGYLVEATAEPFGYTWEEMSAEEAAKFRKPPFKRSLQEKRNISTHRLLDTYATKCSWNMLSALKEWHQERPFDLVTFVELCSPGSDGAYVKGFISQEADYNSRQCSPIIFDIVMSKIFVNHGYFVNAIHSENGPVTQMTLYSKDAFGGDPDIEVKTDITEGRPLSALLWEATKVVVLNVHAVHFRRELIAGKCDRTGATGSEDMCAWARQHFPGGPAPAGGSAFAAPSLDTDGVRKLFGDFLTTRIVEKLVAQGFCSGFPDCLAKLATWRIIAQGDFNDETGELYDLPLLGHRVKLGRQQRVRSCCSDRDPYWTLPYDGQPFTGYADSSNFSYSKATLEYYIQKNGYLSTCTEATSFCEAEYLRVFPDALLPALSAGAPRPPGGGGFARYPGAADLIMDSLSVEDFGFPAAYLQSIVQPISDHDPVVALLAPLSRGFGSGVGSKWLLAFAIVAAAMALAVLWAYCAKRSETATDGESESDESSLRQSALE